MRHYIMPPADYHDQKFFLVGREASCHEREFLGKDGVWCKRIPIFTPSKQFNSMRHAIRTLKRSVPNLKRAHRIHWEIQYDVLAWEFR